MLFKLVVILSTIHHCFLLETIQTIKDLPQYSCNDPFNKTTDDKRCCKCDDACKYFGDCCFDKFSQGYGGKNYQNYYLQQTSISRMFKRIPIMNKLHANQTHRYLKRYIIAKCENKTSRHFHICNNKYSEFDFPVYDENGLIYRNADCAKCHNESTIYKKVNLTIAHCKYNENQTFKEAIDAGVEFSFDTFSYCSIDIDYSENNWFRFDPENRIKLNQGIKTNCSDNNDQLCNSYMAIVERRTLPEELFFGERFVNPNCVSCYSEDITEYVIKENCSDIYYDRIGINLMPFAFSLMVSQSDSTIKCEKGKVFDLIQGKCIEFICKPGYKKEKGSCRNITRKKVIIKPVSVDEGLEKKLIQCMEQLEGSMIYELPIGEMVNTRVSKGLNVVYETNTSMFILQNNGNKSAHHFIENATEVKSKVYTVIKSLPVTDVYGLDYSRHFRSKVCISPKVYSISNISRDCSPMVVGKKYQLYENATMWLVEYHNKSTSSYVSVCNEFHLPSNCTLKFVPKDSYLFVKNNKSIYLGDKEYKPNMYYPDQNGVSICITVGSSMQKFEFEDQVWYIERLVSIIFLFLSVSGEIFTLIVYKNCKELRNTPGKIVMMIAITLLVNDILVIAMFFATLNQAICKILAIILHLFSIALSLWSLAFAYDLWSTFRHSFQRRKDSKNAVLIYNMCVWLTSTVVIIVSLIIEYATDFDVSYEKISDDFCWIRSRNARLILYIAPVYLVVLLSGILVFNMVFKIKMNSNPSLSAQGKANHVNVAVMALKMLVVLGVVELLSIIEVSRANEKLAIANHVMTMLHSFARSLRGVFVLLIFVLTKPVLKKVKKEYTMRRETQLSHIASDRETSQHNIESVH